MEHRVRTGYYSNTVASKSNFCKHVSLKNLNFNFSYIFYTFFRQTNPDNNTQARRTFFSLSKVILLYFYMMFINMIVLGQVLNQSAMSNLNSVIYFSDSPEFKCKNSLRFMINWAVITLLFLSYCPKMVNMFLATSTKFIGQVTVIKYNIG